MNRRRLPIVLAAILLGPVLAGCETLNGLGRRRNAENSASSLVESDDEAEQEKNRPEGIRSFFKNTRLPGAMSSEGADIERSLGVGR